MGHLFFVLVIFSWVWIGSAENIHEKSIIALRAKNTIVYHLTVDYKTVHFKGKSRKAMVVNNSLPAPTLYFQEGKKAIIYVTNKMDVETSIHWHGILLPNFQDGVPYLTTPPIRPGKTHKFEFTLRQSGTYWYHSHTDLQEQRGVYGAIVVEPKKQKHKYDHDLVLVLSDWTNEDPEDVLRILKRGSEWYAIKKGSALSLSEVIAGGALGAQLAMWKRKMPGMDISDIYYDAFLINGKTEQSYSHFKSGEKIRVRIINAAASTYFWLSFGGEAPILISADGIDVTPVPVKKVLHAIAETYDLIVTIPEKKSLEMRAMAQDGSGVVSAIIGKGELLKAPVVPKPDLIEQMKAMAEMHSGDHRGHDSHSDKHKVHKEHDGGNHGKHKSHGGRHDQMMHNKHDKHKSPSTVEYNKHTKYKALNYDDLRSPQKTSFPSTNTLKELHFNLTGNMWRYVWSMNGKTLSQSDIIPIKKGETVRIYLHNTTMMHHPMHLHGHFFRVLSKQGEYSPLKHTVDIPPMETVVIEFNPDDEGDWFFHCHVLYHMKSGMSLVFRHGEKRDPRLDRYPISTILNGDNHWYKWGEVGLMSNRLDWNLVTSNTKNKVMLEGTFSWVDDYYSIDEKLETEISYEYFTSDFFRFYAGVQVQEPSEEFIEEIDYDILKSSTEFFIARIGFRYLLPYFFELDVNVDHRARLQIALEYELLLFPRTEFFAEWEWTMDFGITHLLPEGKVWEQEYEWSVGLNYIVSKNLSVTVNYSNHLSWGGGINIQF